MSELEMSKQTTINKKTIIWLSIFLFVCVILFCLLQYLDYRAVHPIEIKRLCDEEDLIWRIEEIKSLKNYVSISGWALILEEQIRIYDISVVIRNIKTEAMIDIPTILVVREDLNSKFPSETDYSNNGFYSKVNKNLVGLENNTFEIYLKYFNNDHECFIKTKQILSVNFNNEQY